MTTTPTKSSSGIDPSETTVLVAGATGWLGAKITREIAASGQPTRVGLRGGNAHPAAAELAVATNVQVVELDLTRPETLPGAVDGVDVIVSAIQGGPELLVDGQAALAAAAHAAGARRIFPSDFAVDFTNIPHEDHLFFSWRRQGQEAIAATGLAQTNTYNGAFAEMLLPNDFLVFLDWDQATVNFWGSPHQVYDFTATDDVARYVAAAATDPNAPDGPLRVAGFSHSPEELGAAATAASGQAFTLRQVGSTEELIEQIDRRQGEAPQDPNAWVGLQYLRSMATGAGALHDLHNDRYPRIQPTGAEAFFTAWIGG